MADVLITGATSGLGRWLATELGGSGWTVLVHGRAADRVAATADAVEAAGGTAEQYVADLVSLSAARDLAARVAARGRLDVLVNNAGIGFGSPGSSRELSPDGHELRFAVNYLAPVVLTRGLLDTLRASAPARIVNVGSVGQADVDFGDLRMDHGYDGTEAYRRSKLALAAFTFDLAEELAGSGVTVNCLHPATFMDTAMVRDSGVTPRSTVEDGGRAVLRLVTDAGLAAATGQFFNGREPARAHPSAYDPVVRRRLREATERLLAG